MGHRRADYLIGSTHCCAQLRQRVTARHRAEQECARLEYQADPCQRLWQVVDRVESPDRNAQIISAGLRDQFILYDLIAADGRRECSTRIDHIHPIDDIPQPRWPTRIRAAHHQCRSKAALNQSNAIEAIGECSLVQEELDAAAEGAVAAELAQTHVEQLGHGALVRRTGLRDKRWTMLSQSLRTCARWALDFALPPRCAGCGIVVSDVHSFCADCWKQVEFLGEGGCSVCGIPLQATELNICAACLARPPRIARTRAAVAYDELSRSLAIRLKYGRKVAAAKTMARYMLPLIREGGSDRLLVPVPLHRTRLWWRGFNQSALVAHELSKGLGIVSDPFALKRIRRTPPLKGMSPLQRRKAVAGAFQVRDKQAVEGRTVILVDDVLTTGSTAEACARALKRAGAVRVELISWARVVRPAQLMR